MKDGLSRKVLTKMVGSVSEELNGARLKGALSATAALRDRGEEELTCRTRYCSGERREVSRPNK